MLNRIAYIFVVALACVGLYQAQQAISLAREVDHRGDIRACQQDNQIRRTSNERNFKLEKTAKTTAEALVIISKVARKADGSDTEAKLRRLARDAARIQTDFRSSKTTNCKKVFQKP